MRQHLFETSINWAVSFDGKIVNHASREMLCLKGYTLDDAKFHCQLAACKNDLSVISLNLQSKFFVGKHSQVQEVISLWSLAKSSIGDNVKYLLFMNTGQIHF